MRRVQLLDTETKQTFYDKLTFVYIELPKFQLAAEELATEADKWIYLLKYMPELQDIPAELQAETFTHAFEIARETALNEEERWQYEVSLKQARDAYATVESARIKAMEEGLQQGLEEGLQQGLQQGLEQGLEQGRRLEQEQIARAMLARGLAVALISELTGLPEDEINALPRD
jgi:predicted transposase/invertase (TIGR01784 family)